MEEYSNDPELDGKYLGTITQDFAKVSALLKEASYQVRKRGFSEFPIFPVSKTEQPIGKLLIGAHEQQINWNIFITYLDEFIQREIIDKEKLDEFKNHYKNPDEFCCLFIIDGAFTRFVYIPFPEDDVELP